MTLALPGAPFPVTYRELWLPPGIKDWAGPLPPSIEGGHELTFAGARHGTTTDGVHGITGVVTSNINLTAIHNNENILYIKIRFKLDQPFSIASATDQYLFGKYDGPNDYLIGWLEADDGMFHMAHAEGGAVEAIVSAEDTWDIGWHTILVSLHNANGQRLIVDGGAVVAEVGNTTAITLTADFCLLARDDGVSNEGLVGVEVDVVIGIAALTAAQEADLCKGVPQGLAPTEEYLLDEGRGITAYNRGSSGAGADGTLDTSCNWAFGQVQQPVISFDGINDMARNPDAGDISGDLSFVWVGKVKSTYDGLDAANDMTFAHFYADDDNQFICRYDPATNSFRLIIRGGGVWRYPEWPTIPRIIDDYIILGFTVKISGIVELFTNGTLTEKLATTDLPPIAAIPADIYIGRESTVAQHYEISKPLFIAIIDGAFTHKQFRVYSRYLKNIFNLPITI